MHLDKLDDKWMIAGQNRQQDRAGGEKGFSGNLTALCDPGGGDNVGNHAQLYI